MDDLNSFAYENEVRIHIWNSHNRQKLPRKLQETNNSNATSNMHINAPFCNEANNYSLECLEIILNFEKFTTKLGTQSSGNIFQCFIKSGWIDCLDWVDLTAIIGSDCIKFIHERSIRKKIGIGFEIWTGNLILKH